MNKFPLLIEWLETKRLLSAAFDLIGVTDLRNDPAFSSIDGGGVSVAVIDTGLDVNHSLIAPNFLDGVDVVSGASTPTVTNPHGTHVAGIVGSRPDANRGYDGGVAPGTGLIGINVFSQVGGGEVSADNRSIERALQWVLDNRNRYNIVAVNMSLGSGFYTSPSQVSGEIYRDEIQDLEAAGVTVVSAAGNTYGVVRDSSGQQFDLQFANSASPGIISTLNVGAVWEANEGGGFYWPGGNTVDNSSGPDRVVSFSQRPPTNPGNAIFAPGAIIQSTWPNNQLHETQGTSMASPMVAGAVALLQDAALTFGGRLLSPTEIRSILQQTGDTIVDGDDEDDSLFIDSNGNGRADSGEVFSLQNTGNSYKRIDVYAAIQFIANQFGGGGGGVPAGDPNSVIAGAILGPTLNGSPVDAIEGVLGSDGEVSVGNKDVDLYKLTVAVAGEVTIEVAPSATNRSDFNSFLRLFRSNGSQLASDDNSGTGDFSLIKRDLTPGTYYIGVSGAGNGAYKIVDGSGKRTGKSGTFRLGLSLKNVDPNGVAAGAVGVDLTTQGEEPQVFNGFIGADFGKEVGVSDVDLFKIVVPDNGTLLIDIDTPFDSEFVDSYVRVFDESLVEIAENDDGLAIDVNGSQVEFAGGQGIAVDGSNNAIGHTFDGFVSGTVSRGDVYFIGVSDFQNQTYNPGNLSGRAAAGTGGFYNVLISFVSNDRNGSIPQSVDVTSLPLVNQPGIIGADGLTDVGDRDVDVLKIRPTTDGILEIRADSLDLSGNTNPLDTVITLYDGAGVKMAQIDDTQTSGDPLLRISVPKNRDYYAAFSSKANRSFDPYILGSGSPGDTGDYQINIRVISSSNAASLSDDTISSGAVQTVALGSTVAASLGFDDTLVRGGADVDLYQFVAPASGPVEIKAFTIDAFGADTVLRLFTSGGSEITFNDNDSSDTVNSRIQFNAASGTTYYIGVSGAGASSRAYNPNTGSGAGAGATGNYVLSLGGQFASVSGKTLNVFGTAGNDDIRAVQRGSQLGVIRGGAELRFSDSAIGSFAILGGAGNDLISIDPGIDEVAYLDGGAGNDSLTGGDGADTLTGGAGKNTLSGGAGADRINGSGGRDLIFGGAGDDRLFGAGGSDTIDGGGNVDRLFGGDGEDSLIGASGNDKLYGEAGNDTLIGAAGADLLDGGADTDLSDDDNADSRTGIENLIS